MKKAIPEEKPLVNIERSPLFLVSLVILSALLCLWGGYYLKLVHPAGFLLMVPAAIVTFQTFWLMLTPFAIIFDSRAEIQQSWFHHKDRYFIDLDKLSENEAGDIFITYTDGEVEKVNLFGIRPSHKELLKENFRRQIAINSARRI